MCEIPLGLAVISQCPTESWSPVPLSGVSNTRHLHVFSQLNVKVSDLPEVTDYNLLVQPIALMTLSNLHLKSLLVKEEKDAQVIESQTHFC